MNNIEKLAKLFSDRTNPFHLPAVQGNVVSISPLKVQYGNSIILDSTNLVVNRLLAEGFTVEYTDDNGTTTVTKTITVRDPLEIGNLVILIPDAEFKKWYLIAKVGAIS